MNFDNHNMRIIAPLDVREGIGYAKPIKEEFVGGWDHAYNIFKGFVHPTMDGELGWKSLISTSSDSNDALENWKNKLHEVSIQKCG